MYYKIINELFLSLQIAMRFSYKSFKNNVTLSTNIISMLCISLGIMSSIISCSIINGFEYELKYRILSILPHYEIESRHASFNNWKTMLKLIELIPGIVAVTPYINFHALIVCGDKLQAIQIKGIDIIKEKRTNVLSHFMQNNQQNFISGKQQIIISNNIAKKINLQPGDWLNIIIPDINSQKLLPLKNISLQIKSIFITHSQLDNYLAFIPLEDAQIYLNKKHDIDGIAVKVNNPLLLDNGDLLNKIKYITNNDVYIYSWMNKYEYIYHDIKMMRTIMHIAMIIVLGIACFNIISNILIVIKNRNIDIAILISFGASNKLINFIFVWYGILISIIGNFIGIIFGILISMNLTTLIKQIEYFLGYQLLSSNIYFINFLPHKIYVEDVISILIINLLIIILSSWYPAKRASQINPIKILNIR